MELDARSTFEESFPAQAGNPEPHTLPVDAWIPRLCSARGHSLQVFGDMAYTLSVLKQPMEVNHVMEGVGRYG